MKNLKKVLALGLALIMLMGMFTVASAAEAKVASDLSDWASIKHQDAVALNVDLGIIKGMPDGSYQPTENIDRASWAKLAYVAACGDEDADAYLGTVSNLKDVSGNWAEAYISYLAANKYISGDTAGNYNPSNNVTVVEACKTMLTILGYNAKDRGYENDAAWSGKIMSDAKANGLMDGVDKEQTALKPLTRENAAQIVYNALAAQTVEEVKTYDQGIQYVSSYTKRNPLGYKVFNLIKAEGIVSEINEDGTIKFATGDPKAVNTSVTVDAGKINSKVKGTLSDVGQPCVVFVKGIATFNTTNNIVAGITQVDELVSASVAPSNSEPLVTLTKGAAFATATRPLTNIWKKGHDDYVGAEPKLNAAETAAVINYYVDGQATAAVNAGKGDVAKLYDLTDKDGKVDTISILRYFVGKVTGNVLTKTEADGTQKVMIPVAATGTPAFPGSTGLTSTLAGKYIPVDQVTGPWQSLQKGDIILWHQNAKDNTGTLETDADKMVVSIEIPETITGKVTSVNKTKGKLTINGKDYDYSDARGSATGDTSLTRVQNWSDFDNEYTFCLDKNGGLAWATQNTDELVAGNVAVVLETKWISGGTIDASNYMQAKLMLANGDVVITPIDKVAMNNGGTLVMCTPNNGSKTATVDFTNKYVYYGYIPGMDGSQNLNSSLDYGDGFWGYKVNAAGNYELTNLTLRTAKYAGSTNTIAASAKIEQKPTFTTGHSADSTTVFMVEKKDKDDNSTFQVYTGYANVPAINAGLGNLVGGIDIHAKKDDEVTVKGAAAYVYLQTKTYADDTPDGLIFVTDNVRTANADESFSINIVDANGNVTTMKVDSDVITDSTMAPQRTYIVGNVNGGVADSTDITWANSAGNDYVSNTVHAGKLQDIGNGVVTFTAARTTATGTAASFQYDSATVAVLIDVKYDANDAAYKFDTAGMMDCENVSLDANAYETTGTYAPQLYVIEKDGLASYIYVVRFAKMPVAAA